MKWIAILLTVLLSTNALAFTGIFKCKKLPEGSDLLTVHCNGAEIKLDLQMSKVPAEGTCSDEDISAEVKVMGMSTIKVMAKPQMAPEHPDFESQNYMQYIGQQQTPIICDHIKQ